jgi:uncharacterized membrane protein
MSENIYYTLNWWLWLVVLGIISIPLAYVIFRPFADRGIGAAKILTILFSGYLSFLILIIKALPFQKFTLFLVVAIYAAINAYIYFRLHKQLEKFLLERYKLILFEEFIFAAGLFFWSFVRSHQPNINGLEKLMDFGFVNSILRSQFLPPPDMWASGYPINYYWFGHFITAFISKLTDTPAGFAYNLMLGTILGFSLSISFSLTSSLLANIPAIPLRSAVVGGLISAILLNFASNFHTPIYILKNGIDKYWYPDATRFIGYNPNTEDKTIHEFPVYSYVVSDLHAHLLDIPFALLYLSTLYSLSKTQKTRKTKYHLTLILGLLLGVMFMTNTWDFGNYSLATAVVILATRIDKKTLKNFDSALKILLNSSIKTLAIVCVAIITAAPFLYHFQSITKGVALTHTKTPLWQLSILWGFTAILAILLAILVLSRKKIRLEDRFVVGMMITAIILIILPEFVYVKDIYSASHYRANTMFKLTYQAFVISYLSSGYITISILKKAGSVLAKTALALVMSGVFVSILYYPFLAIKSYYGEIFNKESISLSGNSWLISQHPETYLAIEWLNKNVQGQPVILEAPGDSYTDYNVISSYTGLPTPLGWFVHEWLWRGDVRFPDERSREVEQIYTTPNLDYTKHLLQKYNIEYVIVGPFERTKYSKIYEDKFKFLGEKVFESGTTRIYQIKSVLQTIAR